MPDVADVQVQQAVVVEVEEHRARGVADVIDASRLRDVGEPAVPVVLEQDVAAAYRRDEQVLVAVVVDVREGRGHADAVGERDAGVLRDVRKPAAAEILPELVAADLIGEVDVRQAVAVHVGDGDAVAVVVVHRLVRDGRVVHDAVDERDAAFLDAVGELEIVNDLEAIDRRALRPRARVQGGDADVRIGEPDLRRLRGDRRSEHEQQNRDLRSAHHRAGLYRPAV